MRIYSTDIKVGQEIHAGVVARIVNGIVFTESEIMSGNIKSPTGKYTDIELIKWHNKGRPKKASNA